MQIRAHGDQLHDEAGSGLPEVREPLHELVERSGAARHLVVHLGGGSVESDHLAALAREQARDLGVMSVPLVLIEYETALRVR